MDEPKLYLSYKETHTGGEAESDEQWACRSPSYTEVSFIGLSREEPDTGFFPEYREIEVPEALHGAETVFLVIYRYQDGDSFGTSHGNWGVYAAVGTEEEALAIRKDIGDGSSGMHRPWDGYFKSFEGVEIHAFKVGRKGGIIYH